MQVTTDLRQDDHLAFTRFVWYSGARGGWAWFVLIFIVALLFTTVIETKAGMRVDTPTMLLTMCILLAYLSLAQRRLRPCSEGPSLGMRTFKVVADGLIERARNYENLSRWEGIRSIDETKSHIFVFIDNCQAHIVPKRGFAEESHCRAFVDELRRGVASSIPTSFTAPAGALPATCPS